MVWVEIDESPTGSEHASWLNGGGAVTSVQQIGRVCLFLGFATAISTATFGEDDIRPRPLGLGGPFGAPVLNAPFSADATFIFTRTLHDGTPIEQRAKARYYRDSAGRVRAEWVDIGLGGQNRTAGRYTSIWITPGDGWVYAMDPSDQTFGQLPNFLAEEIFHGGNAVLIPLGSDTYQALFDSRSRALSTTNDVALGQQQIEGVNTVGRRITKPLPGDEETEMVEERWESPELSVVIYSRLSQSHAGASVDYRLANIIRTDPPPELFVVQPEMINHGVYDSNGVRRPTISVRPSPR
jgi:hypothetical protein